MAKSRPSEADNVCRQHSVNCRNDNGGFIYCFEAFDIEKYCGKRATHKPEHSTRNAHAHRIVNKAQNNCAINGSVMKLSMNAVRTRKIVIIHQPNFFSAKLPMKNRPTQLAIRWSNPPCKNICVKCLYTAFPFSSTPPMPK